MKANKVLPGKGGILCGDDEMNDAEDNHDDNSN